MNDPLKVIISSQDIPDFYLMLQDFRRQRGNTFAYLQREIEELYPKLKERYDYGEEDIGQIRKDNPSAVG